MSNEEKELEIVDLTLENKQLQQKNQEAKEENKQLQEQITKIEQSALELVDTFYQIQHEKFNEVEKNLEENKTCNFNTNGSCIFYDAIITQIYSCIKKIRELKDKTREENTFKELVELEKIVLGLMYRE